MRFAVAALLWEYSFAYVQASFPPSGNLNGSNKGTLHTCSIVENASFWEESPLHTTRYGIVLKRILYKRRNIEVKREIINKMFVLFQQYVFSPRREIGDQANNLIRNQILEEEHVSWLLAHHTESLHILNRLLRYPERDAQISIWAKHIYEEGELPDRLAEVMGLLIMDVLPAFHKIEDISTIIWAIYYSRNTSNVKSSLILEVVNKDNIDACIEGVFNISGRIDDGSSLMEELLKRYG